MPAPRPERVRVALFGSSTKGQAYLRDLRTQAGVVVECFVDNDATRWHTEIDGVPVRPPADIARSAIDVVVISSLHVEPIFHQLARLGLAERTAVSMADFQARFAPGTGAAPSGATTPSRGRAADAWVDRELRALTTVPVPSRPAGGALALCTVVSNNYLAYARTVSASFLRHHPHARVFICLADTKFADVEYPDARDPRVRVIEARELGIPAFESQAFQYTRLELNTAVKPAFFRHVFDRFPVERLIYLDPDVVVFRPLAPIVERLARHAIVLTPHLTAPVDDGRSPGEIDILKAGAFNLGFLGLSRRDETFRFLDWWAARLSQHCLVEPERGLFVDQRWIDLVPSLFDDYAVLKDPGCNVAYWNLHERSLSIEHGDARVNGGPLYFFHYSGFDPDDIAQVSKYQNRHRIAGPGPLRSLFELYATLLAHFGHDEARTLAYAYGAFDNGVPIADAIRRVYRSSAARVAEYAAPFATAGHSFFAWLNEPAAHGSPLTNLSAGLHATRDELRSAFPDVRGADAAAYVARVQEAGPTLYGIAPALLTHRGSEMQDRFYAPVNHRALPNTSTAIAAAVGQARLVVDAYTAHLPGARLPAGARVLEIGPGAWLGAAVLLACRGARVTVADRYLVPWNDAFHVPFFEALLADVARHPGEDPAPIRRLLEARAFVPEVVERVAASAETLPFPDAAFDIVLSNAVFEHLENVPAALSHVARVTTRNGFSVHQIHFGDHRDDDRQLEYLTLDATLFWSMFELSWGECGNRWRYTDFSAAFTHAGFDVMAVDPTVLAPDGYLEDVRPRLHPDFSGRSDDELRTLCAWMVCRRAESGTRTACSAAPGLLPTGTGEADARALVAACRVLIYGAGAGSRFALDLLDRIGCGDRVVAVCDGDPAVHGRMVRNCRVTRFEDVPADTYDTVIVASRPGRVAIGQRLDAAGLVPRADLLALGFVGAYGRRVAAAAAA